jgi:hypothetical protein
MLNNCQHNCFAGDCTYIYTIKQRLVYQLRYWSRYLFGGLKKKKAGKIFRFMKSKESMVGEDSELEQTCSKLAGTHFTIRKIKFR